MQSNANIEKRKGQKRKGAVAGSKIENNGKAKRRLKADRRLKHTKYMSHKAKRRPKKGKPSKRLLNLLDGIPS